MIRWIFLAVRRTWSIVRKEYVHILMDPGALFLTVLAPAVVLTMLAYVFSFDAEDSNLAVVDMDQSTLSDEYARTLSADGHVRIIAYPRNYDEAVSYLENGRADAVLIIPPGFGAALKAGEYTPVHNVVDGIDASAARQVMGAIDQRTSLFVARQGMVQRPPVEVRTRVWFNENLDSQDSMVPALIALVLILPAMAVALGVTREKESGSLETLITTPLLSSDVLLGKLFVYLTLGLLSAIISLAVAIFWFGVPFRGSFLLWILLTADYLLACMGFSLLVANFVRSQQTAMVLILIVLFVPGFLMSGLSDPINPESVVSQAFSYMLPTMHYMVISRGLALKSLTLINLWKNALALTVMGAVGVGAAIYLFKKKIA